MEVGQSKMPNSEVAGQASVLIFQFKYRKQHVQGGSRETERGCGPMLQGLNKPVNDLNTWMYGRCTVVITAYYKQGL
jgi:phosphate acetyltransferase